MELPSLYAQSLSNAEIRRLVQSQIGDIKLQKALDADEVPEGREQDKGRGPWTRRALGFFFFAFTDAKWLWCAFQERKKEERKKLNEEKKKLKAVVEEFQLAEQAKRNAAVAEQEMAELAAYEKQYGKVQINKYSNDLNLVKRALLNFLFLLTVWPSCC